MSEAKSECTGVFGRLFGHHFVGHYDITPPESLNFRGASVAAMQAAADALSTKKYVCSICARCGEKK